MFYTSFLIVFSLPSWRIFRWVCTLPIEKANLHSENYSGTEKKHASKAGKSINCGLQTILIQSCQLLAFERGGFNKMLCYFYLDVWGDEFNLSICFKWLISTTRCSRWAPYDRFQWSYNPYKWLYKWLTGVITPYSGVMGPYLYLVGALLVISRGPFPSIL